jgi:hypothetical protein
MPKALKTKRRKEKTKKTPKAKTSKAKIPKTKTVKAKTPSRAKAMTQKKEKTGTEMPARQPLKLPDEIKRDEGRPATAPVHAAAVEKKPDQPSAAAFPPIIYRLEVDGRFKSEYPTQETAMTAALVLKRKYPHIRVAIVDSKGEKRIAVDLSQAAA